MAEEELGDIPTDRHLPTDPDRPQPRQHRRQDGPIRGQPVSLVWNPCAHPT